MILDMIIAAIPEHHFITFPRWFKTIRNSWWLYFSNLLMSAISRVLNTSFIPCDSECPNTLEWQEMGFNFLEPVSWSAPPTTPHPHPPRCWLYCISWACMSSMDLLGHRPNLPKLSPTGGSHSPDQPPPFVDSLLIFDQLYQSPHS